MHMLNVFRLLEQLWYLRLMK